MPAMKSTGAQKKSAKARKPLEPGPDGVVLLSGGNPQIAKGYGDAVVQSYIAAMPGWKSAVGRKLDAIVTREVPDVRKAVKWNSPFYGMEDDIWFLGFHCLTKYVKVAFFRGASLDPLPPGTSKQDKVRYLDIYEDKGFDEAQFADWVRQASKLPGEKMRGLPWQTTVTTPQPSSTTRSRRSAAGAARRSASSAR